MTSRLTFTKAPDRKVYWDDTLAGTIEPMLCRSSKWAFLPNIDGAWHVPNALRQAVYYNTQRQIKSALRRSTRFANEG